MFQRVIFSACLIVSLACMPLVRAAYAAEQTRQPQAAAPSMPATVITPRQGSLPNTEDQTIHFQSERTRNTRGSSTSGGFSVWSIVSVIAFMAVLCALLLGGLCVMRKYMPGGRQLFTTPAMELLGRTHLDPRRYVSLLRVGKRVIIVGVTADELTALGEITDESEVTEILEVARPKTQAGLSVFQRLFMRSVQQQETEEAQARARAEAEALQEDMESLKNRIYDVRQSMTQELETVGQP